MRHPADIPAIQAFKLTQWGCRAGGHASPDVVSLNCALATHLAAGLLHEAHALLPALQLTPNVGSYNLLLGGALRAARLDLAQRAWAALLAAMLQPDIDAVNLRLRMLVAQVRVRCAFDAGGCQCYCLARKHALRGCWTPTCLHCRLVKREAACVGMRCDD